MSALLASRRVLRITGADAPKLLHNLSTADVEGWYAGAGPAALPLAFLSPKSRVLADALLHLPCSHVPDEALLDVDAALAGPLRMHLRMHTLRQDVQVRPADDLGVWASWADAAPGGAADADPRTALLGRRAVVEAGAAPAPTADEAEYRAARLALGVAEGAELSGRLPLEANLEWLNYVSFSAGCYVGQELVARTRAKGVVRKRLVPLRRVDDGEAGEEAWAAVGADVTDAAAGKKVGSVVAADDRTALAVLRLEALGKDTLSVGGAGVAADAPAWWPEYDEKSGQVAVW